MTFPRCFVFVLAFFFVLTEACSDSGHSLGDRTPGTGGEPASTGSGGGRGSGGVTGGSGGASPRGTGGAGGAVGVACGGGHCAVGEMCCFGCDGSQTCGMACEGPQCLPGTGGSVGSGTGGSSGSGGLSGSGGAGGSGAACTDKQATCPANQVCDLSTPGRCVASTASGTCIVPPTSCAGISQPVCACNGMTYDNDCIRQMARAQKDHDGACTTGGGTACGTQTCSSTQACIHPSPGGTCNMPDAGECPAGTMLSGNCCVPIDNPHCTDVLPVCSSGSLSCDCFSQDPCGTGCIGSVVQGRNLFCVGA